MTLLNTVEHPHSTISILDWMLAEWEKNPNMALTVVAKKNDGMRMNVRLRVRLSQIRKVIKEKTDDRYKRFGFESRVISWTDESGEEFDALCLYRRVTRRHKIITSLMDMGLGGRG